MDTDAIYGWIRNGELEAQNLGRASQPRWRIARSAIEDFKARRRRQIAVKIGQDRSSAANVSKPD